MQLAFPSPTCSWMRNEASDWRQDVLKYGPPGTDNNSRRVRHTGIKPIELELAN